MANPPTSTTSTSSTPIPTTDTSLASKQQQQPQPLQSNATATATSLSPETEHNSLPRNTSDLSITHEPDTALGASETTNSNENITTTTTTSSGSNLVAPLKQVTAPPSPPVPTPPFTDSFENPAHEQQAMSALSLGSPKSATAAEATADKAETEAGAEAEVGTGSNGVAPPAIPGDSIASEQPTTAIPAVVDQPTSDVRDEPKVTPSTEVQMEDVASESAAVASKPIEPTGPVDTPAQDSDMPDAPAQLSSPPAGASSALTRARSESEEPERPNKRQRTAEAETLPDASAPVEQTVTTANGEPPKEEPPSPTTMDTTADHPDEANKEETSKSNIIPMEPTRNRAILNTIKGLKRIKDATAYLSPVDPVKLGLPTYLDIVKNPISIQDIETKLTSLQYQNMEEVKADFDLMVGNSLAFNGPDHTVYQAGKRLQDKFLHSLAKILQSEAQAASAKAKKGQAKRPSVAPQSGAPVSAPASTTASTPAREAPPVAPVAPVAPVEPSPIVASPTPVEPAAVVTQSAATAAVTTPPAASTPVAPKVDTRVRRESTRGTAPNSAMSPTAASPTFSLTPSGMPQIRRDSIVTVDGRPKRPIHAPPSRDLPYSDVKPRRKKSVAEFKFCESIMKEIWKKQHANIAYPFYNPVDPVALEIPDYFKIIKKPMDLSEIQRKLNHNEYNNCNEFEADMRLMLNNCYKFNPVDSPVYICGKALEALFNEKWDQKPSFKEETPTPPAEEEEEEEEEDDEEEEEEDVQNPQLEKLEAQLSRLHSEIETIRKAKGNKKKSPPAAAKGHKKKASGSGVPAKSSTKSTPVSGKKKSSTKKKPEPATPYMTFAQKQELSERINTLSPNKMHQALNLIRQNHPNLAQDGSEEIELDIDELAPATLHKLYKFVNENTLAPDKPAPPVPAPLAKPKASQKGRKKNKPMSAVEQERKIREIKSQLEGFDGQSPTDEGPRSLASMGAQKLDAESSSDDDSSSGSESEEE